MTPGRVEVPPGLPGRAATTALVSDGTGDGVEDGVSFVGKTVGVGVAEAVGGRLAGA